MTHQYFNILEVNAESNKVVFWKGDVLLVDGKVATSLDCCCTTTTTTTTTTPTTTATTPTTTITTTPTTTITTTPTTTITTTPTTTIATTPTTTIATTPTTTTTTTPITPTPELCCPEGYPYFPEANMCCPPGFVWNSDTQICVNEEAGAVSPGQPPNVPCEDVVVGACILPPQVAAILGVPECRVTTLEECFTGPGGDQASWLEGTDCN